MTFHETHFFVRKPTRILVLEVFLCVALYVDFCVIYIHNVVESFKAAQQLAYFLTCMTFDYLLSCKVFHHFAYNLMKKLTFGLKKKKFYSNSWQYLTDKFTLQNVIYIK